MHPPAFLGRFAVMSFLALAFAGCSSDGGPGERGSSGPRRKPPTPMAGHESFFAGQILAEISVGTEGLPQVGPGEGGGSRGGGMGRRGGGGGGGRLNIAGGGGGISGDIGGGIPMGGGGGMGRPVMIHLRFTNQGPGTVTLTIDDFVSPLGNFAVRPEKLVLEPGQSLATEPMTSQLAGEFSETNATLVLRVGPKAEKKTFTLHAVKLPDQEKAKDEVPAPAK